MVASNLYVINVCTILAGVLVHGTSSVFINSFIDSQMFNNSLLHSGYGEGKDEQEEAPIPKVLWRQS